MPLITALDRPDPENAPRPWIFLAGGITGCPDWQRELASRLLRSCSSEPTLLNPRREDFPIEDPNAAREQITWEFNWLNRADLISFWFAENEIQPIALYELGAWAMTFKPIAVGVHPDYPRRQDVEVQLELRRGPMPIMQSLEDHAGRICERLRGGFLGSRGQVDAFMHRAG